MNGDSQATDTNQMCQESSCSSADKKISETLKSQMPKKAVVVQRNVSGDNDKTKRKSLLLYLVR